MSKPIIICAGFFSDRHFILYNELEGHFDIRMISPVGKWPKIRLFQVTQHQIQASESAKTAETYRRFLSKIEAEFECTENKAQKDELIDFLVRQWNYGQYIQNSITRFHKENHIASILIVNDHLAPNRALIDISKKLNIPTLYIDHGFGKFNVLSSKLKNKKTKSLPVADIVCVENKLQRNILLQYFEDRNSPAKVCITGTPIDSKPERVRSLRSRKKEDTSISTVVYCPSWNEANSMQNIMYGNLIEHKSFELFCRMIQNISEKFPHKSFQTVVKLHPTLSKTIGVDISSYFSRIASHNNINLSSICDGPISKWLAQADLLITSNLSSVSWESFLYQVPSITYASIILKNNLKPNAWKQPNMLAQWGVQHFLDDNMDWSKAAAELLESKWDGSFSRLCDSHISDYEYLDGKTASQNILKVLKDNIMPAVTPKKQKTSRNLKILEVVHSFPPHSFAGTELYTLNLSKELQKLEHEVTVLYPITERNKTAYSFEKSSYEGLNVVQFNTYSSQHPNKSDFLNIAFDDPFKTFLLEHSFDVIHFQHLIGLSPNWLSIAKDMGITVFLKLDDLWFYCPKVHLTKSDGTYCSGPESLDKCFECLFPSTENMTPSDVANAYQYLAYRRAYLRYVFPIPDLVHTPSHFVKDTYLKNGLENSNFHIIPTGIMPFEVKPKMPDSKGKIRIAFLGHIHKRKGVLDFLNAIKIYSADLKRSDSAPNLRFVLYGTHFNDDLYRHMLFMIGELQNVEYKGSFRPDDRSNILSEIDLLVVPSIGENYPFIIREALFANIPVVATDIAGVPEIIRDNKNGFIYKPGDIKTLASIFTRISKDPELLFGLDPEANAIKIISVEARELEDKFFRSVCKAHYPQDITNGRSQIVSIIIPVFNQIKYTRQCLETLFANTPDDLYELIVVDNASTDGTKEYFAEAQRSKLKAKRLKLIRNEENLGFAKACNQGARAASGKYLVFLNNDITPLSGWLVEMVRVIESDEGIGVVGSKLLFPDGTIQHAGVVISSNGLPYHLYRGCPDKIEGANKQRDFQIVTAACMLISRQLFFEVGGFDERYVNGCEDIDLCLKVGQVNRGVVYNPKSVLIHFEGQTEGRQNQMDHNRRLLLNTWRGKLKQDDKFYLNQDSMELLVGHDGSFQFVPSPDNPFYIKLSIIIVTYNSLEDIQKCITSIINNASLTPYEIIVVDNVSSDGTQEYLKTLENMKIVLNSTNNGFSKGCNQGIEIANGDYIVLLNPDTVVSPGWDAHMVSHFRKGVGAVGPVSNYVAAQQKIGLYFNENLSGEIDINTLENRLYQQNKGKSIETRLLIGFCMMIKKEVIDKVGMLDEDLFLGNDDLDLSLRLRNAGYKLLVATDTFIYHKGQASFKSEPSEKTKALVQESTDSLFKKLQKQYGAGQVPSPQELWGIDWFNPSRGIKTNSKLTSIIILAHNQLQYTKKCIESIFKYSKDPFELIVIDNGSTDGTGLYLEKLMNRHGANGAPKKVEALRSKQRGKKGRKKKTKQKNKPLNKACRGIKVIQNSENLGFAAGNNQGIEAAIGDYILLMNNDIVVTSGWLGRMISCAEKNPRVGIVGPMSNYVSGPQLIKDVSYNTTSLARLAKFAGDFAESNADQSRFIWRVVGFCMLIKRAVIDKIGGMDSRYGLGNFEDDDFSLRASLAGFESWMAEDCFIHHFGNRTFIGANIDYRESLHKNWEIFKEKWGLPQELPYGSSYNMSQITNDGFDPAKHYFAFSDKEPPRVEKLSPSSIDNKNSFISEWTDTNVQSSTANKEFVSNLIAKAGELDQQDKADLAMKSLIGGIGQAPDEKRLYYALAELLVRHGQYQDGLDALNEMPAGDDDLQKLELTAYCLEGMEKYNEAGACAEEILVRDPDSPLALNLKGILAFRQGYKDKAEMLFKGSIKSDPGFGEPYTNLGVLKWEGGEQDHALDLLERGFILSPTLLDIVTLYHSAITDLGQFERAEPIFRDAVQLHPNDKRLKHLFIDDLIKQGKHSQAMNVIEEAIIAFETDDGFLAAALKVRKLVGTYTRINTRGKRDSLSLCMIVKNEEEYLAQCLASLKPVVDEIIVVDTGSTDRTRDIARIFGARVFDCEWNEDFSAARNFSIEKASGDWILVMDADEVLSTQDHKHLRKLVKRSNAGHVAYSFITRNYINQVNTIGFNANKGEYAREEAAMGWMPSDKVRLFPNNRDIRFEFPIHEKVEPSIRRQGLEIKKCKVPVHHYGKLNEERGNQKCAAYYELGKKKLDELGGDIDAIRELAVQAETIGKETEAIELWQRLLVLQPDSPIAFVNMATLYLKLDRYEDARETAQQAVHIAPRMKEALNNYALCELYCGNVSQTITSLEKVLDQEPDYLSARFLLAVAYCCVGRQSEGLREFLRLESTTGSPGLAIASHTFAEKLIAAQRDDYATSLLEAAIAGKYSNPDVMRLYDQVLRAQSKRTLPIPYASGFTTAHKEPRIPPAHAGSL